MQIIFKKLYMNATLFYETFGCFKLFVPKYFLSELVIAILFYNTKITVFGIP